MEWYEFGWNAWGSLQLILIVLFMIFTIIKIRASQKSFVEIEDLEKNHTLPSFNKPRFHTRIEEYQGFCKNLNLHWQFVGASFSCGVAMLFAYFDWETATYVWSGLAGACTAGYLTESLYRRYQEPKLLSKWVKESENLKRGIYTVCDEKTQLGIYNGHIIFENEHDGIEFASVDPLIFVEQGINCNVFRLSMYSKRPPTHQIPEPAFWKRYLLEYVFSFEFPPSMDSNCKSAFCKNYSTNKYGTIPTEVIEEAFEKRKERTTMDIYKVSA